MHRLLLAGVLGLWAATASAQPIKIGELGIVADAPFYIAIEKGYFAAEKLDVVLERFTSAAQATAPLSTNQIQAIGGGVGAALYNAAARDCRIGEGQLGQAFAQNPLGLAIGDKGLQRGPAHRQPVGGPLDRPGDFENAPHDLFPCEPGCALAPSEGEYLLINSKVYLITRGAR